MKRTRSTVVTGIACAVACCACSATEWTNLIEKVRARGDIDRELQSPFQSFQLHPYADLGQWIKLQAATAGLDTHFDGAAQETAQHHVLLIAHHGLESIPKRYFLGWMFHLFGLVGRVEGDTLIVKRSGEMSDQFKCYQESNGTWRKKIDAALDTQVSITGNDWYIGQALSFLAHKTGAPLLLDQPLMANESNVFPPPLNRPMDLAFTNTPFAKVLTSILSERGLTNRVQGGVIFIHKQEERPNTSLNPISGSSIELPEKD